MFVGVGVCLDYSAAVACALWSTPVDSYHGLPVTDAAGQVLRYQAGVSVCQLIPEYADVAAPADVRNPNDPTPLRWDQRGARRGVFHKVWRTCVVRAHQEIGASVSDSVLIEEGSIVYIRFGFPLRSWEAWWHDDGTVLPNGYLKGPRPIAGLTLPGTLMTNRWTVPRAVPIAARPGLVAINACVYGAAFAGVWYSVRAWRHRRAITKLGRCPTCGYVLAGLTSGVCPECGEIASSAVVSAEPNSSNPSSSKSE